MLFIQDLVPPAEGVDVKASIKCFFENAIKTALIMSRDLGIISKTNTS